MATRTAQAGTQSSGAVATASFANSLPGGWIGYVEDTTGQGSITAEVTLAGLTVTAPVGASRRIEVRCKAAVQSTVANDSCIYRIKEGSTVVVAYPQPIPASGGPGQQGVEFSRTITPSAGSHTYTVSLARSSGSGTLNHVADAAFVSFLRVVDVGPA